MKSYVATIAAFLAAGTLLDLPSPFSGQNEWAPPNSSSQEKEQAKESKQVLEPPVQRYLRKEQKRLEEEILGNWLLMDFKDPNSPLSNETYQGWACFSEGYLTMFLQCRASERGFFRQVERRNFQVGSHRYRISDALYLQTSSILGSTNFTDEERVEFEPSGFPREFKVEIGDSVLRLTNREFVTFEFRHLEESKFPLETVLDLQKSR